MLRIVRHQNQIISPVKLNNWMGIEKIGSCGLISFYDCHLALSKQTYNKTRTAIWIKLQTFLRGSVIALHFMQAISLLRKYVRMEIHRKICIVSQRGKSVPVLYQLFRGRGFLLPLWKQEAGRNVGRAGCYRGVASRQRWNNCFCELFRALLLRHCRCSQIWKAKGKSACPC